MLKKIQKNKKLIYPIILFVFLIILLTCLVCLNQTQNFDENILLTISTWRNESLTKIMILVSELSGYFFVTFLTIFLSLVFWKKRYYLYFLINSLGVIIVNNIFKLLVNRTRPLMFMIIEEKGKSFPSGHAMISLAFFGFLGYLCYQKFNNKYLKVFSLIFSFLLILLVGFSRLYLGVHYLTDVVTGYLVSGIILLIELNYFKKGGN